VSQVTGSVGRLLDHSHVHPGWKSLLYQICRSCLPTTPSQSHLSQYDTSSTVMHS